eukprot:TRINITY_DN1758_c0_g3_i1.p1 TRINITY_DN1758_c0_g3~~TRINITY_DN1758_c0_g3_i1.p1  ORF type:complete len:155 (+),score=40.11 TRINITY_DN1758_c0_g3_i1:234-698(+)
MLRRLTQLSRVPKRTANKIKFAAPKVKFYSTGATEEVKPVKQTTGIPGVPVIPRAREILIRLYQKYLEELEANFEPRNPYRVLMEKFTKEKLNIVVENKDIFDIEEKIGLGLQIEELIAIAENEFKLIPFMLEHKPWATDSQWSQPLVLWSDIN